MEDIMGTAAKLLRIILVPFFMLSFIKATGSSIGKITFILGSPQEITILKSGVENWTIIKLFSHVYDGDRIKTKQESRCEISLNDRSLIRIGENSMFHRCASRSIKAH